MLDKSVPYASLYMCRKAETPVPVFPLPPGFRYTLYRDGDDADWARIETSVDEFDNEFSALMLFKQQYIPHTGELYKRLLFIETDDGYKVATANAWWSVLNPAPAGFLSRIWQNGITGSKSIAGSKNSAAAAPDRRAWLHWVSVTPQYQGIGLGKALVSRSLHILRDIEGDVDMYLSTQTWSYKAIDIYKKCGFKPTDEKKLYICNGKKPSEYKKALKILSAIPRN